MEMSWFSQPIIQHDTMCVCMYALTNPIIMMCPEMSHSNTRKCTYLAHCQAQRCKHASLMHLPQWWLMPPINIPNLHCILLHVCHYAKLFLYNNFLNAFSSVALPVIFSFSVYIDPTSCIQMYVNPINWRVNLISILSRWDSAYSPCFPVAY